MDIDLSALQKQRDAELAQCDALVEAVRAFIKEHIEEHGPNVRYSDALSMVSLSLVRPRRYPTPEGREVNDP